MLLGNYSVLNKNPGKSLGGALGSFNRAQSQTSGAARGRFYGESSVSGVTETSSTPTGYRPPYSWILAPKEGGLSSFNEIEGLGVLAPLDLAGGVNGVATISGVGTITNADLALIVSAVAALTGLGTLTGDIAGSLSASATLDGTGTVAGTLGALVNAVAALQGIGTITVALPLAVGTLSADITPFTTLSPENLAASVWNAVAASFDEPGTMGEKLNNAVAGTGLTLAQFLALK